MINFIKRWFAPSESVKAQAQGAAVLDGLRQWQRAGGSTTTQVSPEGAMLVASVNAAVNTISQSIAGLPLTLQTRDGKRDESRAASVLLQKLRFPNPNTNGVNLLLSLTRNLVLYGNSFLFVEWRGGMPVRIVPVPPRYIEVECPIDVTREDARTRYRIQTRTGHFTSDSREIIHFQSLGADGITGTPTTAEGQVIIRLARAMDEATLSFFNQGMRPSFAVVMPEGKSMTNEAYERITNAFTTAYGGAENAGKIPVVDAGARIETLSASNQENEIRQLREFQVREIARLFGIPAHRLGAEDKHPRSQLVEENRSFIQSTLKGVALILERGFDELLSQTQKMQGVCFKFDFTQLLRETMRDSASAFRMALDGNAITRNEFREALNLPPLNEGGDDLVQAPNTSQAQEGMTN